MRARDRLPTLTLQNSDRWPTTAPTFVKPTHQPIINDEWESTELDIMNILNLALPGQTCYESLASTHPDKQVVAQAGRAAPMTGATCQPCA